MSRGADDAERAMRTWVEATLGGRIVACERQARWRPAWFLEVERAGAHDGERLALYFRGDRGLQAGGAYALEHEMRCLQILGEAGLPVPRVHGFCEAPRGILMDRAPGRADLSTAASAAERAAVQQDYMRILARIHDLDVAPFEAAGFRRPTTDAELALADLPIWERGFRKAKSRPEPLLEFGLAWLHRSVPAGSGRVSFVCSDSGQFLFEDGRVTAVLDLELAHLGDPAEDLAGLRTRDLSEPLGDLRRAVRTYEQETGRAVDRRLVDFHTVRFALVTPLAIAGIVARPPPKVDFVQYLCWYHVYGRAALEVIAHVQGIVLDPPELLDETPTRHSVGHDALAAALEPDERDDAYAAYRIDSAARLATYLRRAERLGPAIEAADAADVAALTGERPASWDAADAALEACVLAAGPERDAEIVRCLHRRTVRQEFLLAPVLRELADARIQMLD